MAQNSAIVLNGQIGFPSNRQLEAAAGKFFVATNPTVGTGVAYALKTAWSATANGMFLIQNTNSAGGPNIYLDRLMLTQTATAPTGTLSKRFEVYNETGIVSFSAGSQTITPVQLNTGSGFSQTTGAVVQAFSAAAATVPAAVGTRRLQALVQMPTGVAVQHDQYVIEFSTDAPAASSSPLTAARATAPAVVVAQAPPVIIPPQTTSWINCWWLTAAANTPSYEFSLSFIEL